MCPCPGKCWSIPASSLRKRLLEILPLVRGEWESFVRGRGSDLYRIREYMPEDSARHVDWKATAKSGSLKVREFAREDERKVCIAFDNPEPGLISERSLRESSRSHRFSGLALFHAGGGSFLRCSRTPAHPRSPRISGMAGRD